MLYALGPLTFEIAPVNAHEINHVTEASYVEKPVVGRRPPLEFTGDGPEEITVAAKLFPHKFGGLSSLGMLDQMRQSGVPHVFVRGDGALKRNWWATSRTAAVSCAAKGRPEPVRVHDFVIPELGKAVPYGVYDIAANLGWVSVGISHDTAAFAVESIRRWWQRARQGPLSPCGSSPDHGRLRRQQRRSRCICGNASCKRFANQTGPRR